MTCNSNCNKGGNFCCSSNKCEKVCIEAKRIFDACKSELSLNPQTLTVSFPAGTPATLSIQSISNSGNGVISDLTLTPVVNSTRTNVSYRLTIPVQIIATDTTGSVYNGVSSLVVNVETLLRVPVASSISPTAIEADSALTGVVISYSDGILVANICVVIISKVTAPVILAVPTYGYPRIPSCISGGDVCEGLFNQPIFPVGV